MSYPLTGMSGVPEAGGGPAGPAGWYEDETGGSARYWDTTGWYKRSRTGDHLVPVAVGVAGRARWELGADAAASRFWDGRRWYRYEGGVKPDGPLPVPAPVEAFAAPVEHETAEPSIRHVPRGEPLTVSLSAQLGTQSLRPTMELLTSSHPLGRLEPSDAGPEQVRLRTVEGAWTAHRPKPWRLTAVDEATGSIAASYMHHNFGGQIKLASGTRLDLRQRFAHGTPAGGRSWELGGRARLAAIHCRHSMLRIELGEAARDFDECSQLLLFAAYAIWLESLIVVPAGSG